MQTYSTLFLPALPPFPSNALPVLIYRKALEPPHDFARLFAENGWQGIWINGVYGFHHFHAQAHEALGIQRGHGMILLGGPDGEEIPVIAGDALLLPAGTGHKLLYASDDLSVVGAYPKGQAPDMERGSPARYNECVARVNAVLLPDTDPVYEDGPAARWYAFSRES